LQDNCAFVGQNTK